MCPSLHTMEYNEGQEGSNMSNTYIHVGSITNAMRGRALLEKQGIRALLQRSPHPAEGDGCGYRLLVTGQSQKAERLLRENGVRVIRITDAL